VIVESCRIVKNADILFSESSGGIIIFVKGNLTQNLLAPITGDEILVLPMSSMI
jgi:hypothetical protein